MHPRFRWLAPAVASSALLSGFFVYLFARPVSVFYAGPSIALPFAGQLPAFLHTLAFALACALVAGGGNAIRAVLAWGAVELVAEFLQHPALPLPGILEAYRRASTFDFADLGAIALAVLLAIYITAGRPKFPGQSTRIARHDIETHKYT